MPLLLSSKGDASTEGTGGPSFRRGFSDSSFLKESSNSCNIFFLRADSSCFMAAMYFSSAGGASLARPARESASRDAKSSKSFAMAEVFLFPGSIVQPMVFRRSARFFFATVLSFLYSSKPSLFSMSLSASDISEENFSAKEAADAAVSAPQRGKGGEKTN